MINKIFEALATFSDVAYMVWFIPAFLHVSRLRDIKPYIWLFFKLCVKSKIRYKKAT